MGTMAEKLVQRKFDQLAADYVGYYGNSSNNLFNFEKERRSQIFLEFAQSWQPESLLDTGCGPGISLSRLARHLPNTNFFGVDLSHAMLKQSLKAGCQSISVAQAQALQLPFPTMSFDLVSALGLIDYLADPGLLFDEVWRVLQPEGHFVLSFPSATSVPRMFRDLLRSLAPFKRHSVAAQPRNAIEMSQLLADSGFEVARSHHITYGNGIIAFPWSVAMSRKIERSLSCPSLQRYLAWSCVYVARKL